MHHDVKIKHVPDKQLVSVDLVFRQPLPDIQLPDEKLQGDFWNFISTLPVSSAIAVGPIT